MPPASPVPVPPAAEPDAPPSDYVPFGDEWERGAMRETKATLVRILGQVGPEAARLRAENAALLDALRVTAGILQAIAPSEVRRVKLAGYPEMTVGAALDRAEAALALASNP